MNNKTYKLTEKQYIQIYNLLKELSEIVKESDGISGWHLNGNLALWNEFDFIDDLEEMLIKLKEKIENNGN